MQNTVFTHVVGKGFAFWHTNCFTSVQLASFSTRRPFQRSVTSTQSSSLPCLVHHVDFKILCRPMYDFERFLMSVGLVRSPNALYVREGQVGSLGVPDEVALVHSVGQSGPKVGELPQIGRGFELQTLCLADRTVVKSALPGPDRGWRPNQGLKVAIWRQTHVYVWQAVCYRLAIFSFFFYYFLFLGHFPI